MRYFAFFLFLALAAHAFPEAADADMYKWTDPSGVVHFSSEPRDPSAQRLKDTDLPPVTDIENASQRDLVPDKTSLPGPVTMMVRLLFDGNPLSESTAALAVFRMHSNELKQWFTPDYSYDRGAGVFRLRGMAEGTYIGQVTIDADRSNPDQYPGDYKGKFTVTVLQSAPATVNADMERIIHLTGPEDNARPLKDWGKVCSSNTEFETPVAVSWEALGKGVVYSYTIVRTVCQPFSFQNTVAGDKTTASKVVLDLPPNREGEFYTLRLEARKNDRIVGSLMTHGENGWGWDYRFRVVPKRGPTRVITPAR